MAEAESGNAAAMAFAVGVSSNSASSVSEPKLNLIFAMHDPSALSGKCQPSLSVMRPRARTTPLESVPFGPS
jgi:hypothetical protein